MNVPAKTQFVPLAVSDAAGEPRSEFHVLVVPQAQNARPLSEIASSASDAGRSDLAHPHQPRVTLQKEGERIVGIQIQCSCGQQIDLACSYQSPAPG